LKTRTNNALVQSFLVDTLNQLTNVSRTGTLTVAGSTTSPATNVTVNSLSAELYADTTFAKAGFTPADGTNTYTAIAKDSYGRADTNSISVYLPASVSFRYDLNGNLTYDGVKAYVYDDENQLIGVTATNQWKTEFSYDGKLRLRVKKEYTWQSSAWVQTSETHYIYDGMLVIQERDGSNQPEVSYTRGKDLSGTFEGAGGIGGLLARTDNTTTSSVLGTAFYHADGNGNITAMMSTNGLIVAWYQYDPYGRILAQSGPLASANSYRFSSKQYHDNAGLYYYGYRFYAPELQRWVNRDPIQELGGVNLFMFVGNDPNQNIDYSGQFFGQNLILGTIARVMMYFVQKYFVNSGCSKAGNDCSSCCNASAVALGASCAALATAFGVGAAGMSVGAIAAIPIVGPPLAAAIGPWIGPLVGISVGAMFAGECMQAVAQGRSECMSGCPQCPATNPPTASPSEQGPMPGAYYSPLGTRNRPPKLIIM